MQVFERKILILNLLQKQPIQEETFQIGNIRFTTVEHSIGWNFEAAEAIIRNYDGYVDGFALIGIPKHIGVGKHQIHHPGYIRLLRGATKSSIYVADDLRDFFSDWTLQRVLKEQPQIFFGRKVLFQCASITSILPKIVEAGANISAADPLMISGIPLLLRGQTQMTLFFQAVRPVMGPVLFNLVNPSMGSHYSRISTTLKEWMKDCDIFVGFGFYLAAFESFDVLAGKIIMVDHVDAATRKRLESANIAQIIEFIPEQTTKDLPNFKYFPVLSAVVDQMRLFEKSTLSFSNYLLKWIERTHLTPRTLKSARGMRRKCAFIIHALKQEDLWNVKPASFMRHAPRQIRGIVEREPPIFRASTWEVSRESPARRPDRKSNVIFTA